MHADYDLCFRKGVRFGSVFWVSFDTGRQVSAKGSFSRFGFESDRRFVVGFLKLIFRTEPAQTESVVVLKMDSFDRPNEFE